MHRFLILIAVGCSAGTYNQSALPVAPPFNPVTDSPITIGQPGYEPDAPVVPQPNPRPTRVLPQTPETRRGPGIWAATTPSGGPGAIVGVALPPLPDAETDVDREVVPLCAQQMNAALVEAKVYDAAARLDAASRKCLAARLYLACAQAALRQNKQIPNDAQFIRELVAASVKMVRSAEAFRAASCVGDLDPYVDTILAFVFRPQSRGVH